MEEAEIVAYAIVSILEELEFIGLLCRDTLNEYYQLFGNHCGLVDLLPQVLPSPTKEYPMANVKSDHKGLIITRKKDQYVDPKYFEWALEHYQSAFGCAFGIEGTMGFTAVSGTVKVSEGEESLENTQTVFNHNMVMYFGRSSKEFADEDLQPFALVEVEEQPVIMAFLDGELEDYSLEDRPHSAAYYCVEEYLREKVKDIYDKAGGDLTKVKDALSKPIFSKEIKAMLGAGTLVLVLSSGEIIRCDFAASSAEYGWGTTSNVGDFKVTEPDKDQDKTAKVHLNLMEKLKRVAAENKKPPVDPKKEDTLDHQVIAVPQNLQEPKNTKGLESWKNRHFENLPEEYKTAKTIPARFLKKDSPLRERLKTLEATAIGDAMASALKNVVAEVLPIISPQERTEIQKIFKDYTVASDKLWDWEKIGKVDEGSPSFSEQSGYPLSLAMKLPHMVFWQLISHHPKSAYALMFSMRNLISEYISSEIDTDIEDLKKDIASGGKPSDKKSAAL